MTYYKDCFGLPVGGELDHERDVCQRRVMGFFALKKTLTSSRAEPQVR